MLCIPQQNPLKYGFTGIEHRLYISLFIEFYNKQAHTQTVRTFKLHMYVDDLETS